MIRSMSPTLTQRAVTTVVATVIGLLALCAPPAHAESSGSSAFAGAFGKIDAGPYDTCVVHSTGPRCWGLNDEGQLGIGTHNTIGDGENAGVAPVLDFNGGTVKEFA